MKTLKIAVALLIGLCFASNKANSQKPDRIVYNTFVTYNFKCMGQALSGVLTVERTIKPNQIQARLYGTMTGSSDGLEYFADIITNISPYPSNNESGQNAIIYTQPGMGHISRDGKLIAVIHYAYHFTVNANGELTTEHGDVYECNLVGEGSFK